MKQPRFWKTLERHPLSCDYEDITGIAWDHFVAGLKQFGILDRKITLHDEKVLDGWQLLRACIECGIRPEFSGLPKGVTAEEFVRVKNDNRRHEAAVIIAARRERVAAARAEKKSLRTIAVEESIDQKTVRKDLEKVQNSPGVDPPAHVVETPIDDSPTDQPKVSDGKVIGRDGKIYPATKPKVLCARCRRVGEIKDCLACIEARKPPLTKSGKPRFDEKKFDKAYGPLVRLVDERANAMGKGPNFERCQQLLGEFLEAYKIWKKETA